MKRMSSELDGHSQDQEKGEDLFEGNESGHGFKPLSDQSDTIREAAVLLQKSDDAEQLRFFHWF